MLPAPIWMAPRFAGLALLTAAVMTGLSAFLWTTYHPALLTWGIVAGVVIAASGAILLARCWRAASALQHASAVEESEMTHWIRRFVTAEVAFVLSIALLALVAAVPIWYVLLVAVATAINGGSYVRRFRQSGGPPSTPQG